MARQPLDLTGRINGDGIREEVHAADFPVRLRPLFYDADFSYEPVPGRLAVVREDTGEALGVVSDRYTLVRHDPDGEPAHGLRRVYPRVRRCREPDAQVQRLWFRPVFLLECSQAARQRHDGGKPHGPLRVRWARQAREAAPVGQRPAVVYDGNDLFFEVSANGASLLAEYNYYPGVDRPHSVRRGGSIYYYATNHAGSVEFDAVTGLY